MKNLNCRKICKILFIFILLNSSLFAKKQHYLSIDTKAKYKEGFKYFDYVNAKAKKGGVFKSSTVGTFDSFNAFTLKGNKAAGLSLIYDSLMTGSLDEPFVSYGLIANKVEVSPLNDWVKFYINPKAHFHDGVKITATDVKFTFELLLEKGMPQFKRYYLSVKNVEIIDKLTIKFNFKDRKNKELPLILSQLKVLPKHFWENKNFLDSDSIVPLGSGPYKIKKYKFSKYIIYERDKNYWARNEAVNIGQYNFGEIKYDYYKDRTVTLEAFIAGEFDFRTENTAKNWATLYKGKKFDEGKIIKAEIKHEKPQGMQGFIFNLRKPLFQDLALRKAINLVYDFEWANKKLFYNQYKRIDSYFDNCELSSSKLPSKEELLLLNPLSSELPKEVFTKEFKNNVTTGSGNIRKELRAALKILQKRGWKFENKVLVKNGKKFEFEILLGSSSMERILNPFIKNLKKIGIIAKLRVIDKVAYANKVKNFNFDMIIKNFRISLSPGNELRGFWGSESSNIVGSRNVIGIESKAVDSLIESVIKAKNRNSLIIAVRALDRVLLHNYYVIPNWYISSYRIAYWNKFNKPKTAPKYSLGIYSWWIKDEFIK